MENMEELIFLLREPDNRAAHRALQALLSESGRTGRVYPYWEVFVEMLGSENSYQRNRGLLLLAANVRWDGENRMGRDIDRFLRHITDDKPVTARQCIQALPEIAARKPDLAGLILRALERADFSGYADSMRPLLQKDREDAAKKIKIL